MKKASLSRSYRQSARAQAASETGRRIVEVFQKRLNEQWYDEITLDQVAEDSGVTVQTIVRRFSGKAGLLGEAIGAMVRGAGKRRATIPGDPDRLARNLVNDYEQNGDTIIRLVALEPRHAAISKYLASARLRHRDWIARAFATELEPVGVKARQAALDALVVSTDVYTWKLLRRDIGRGVAATQATIAGMLRSTLAGLASVDDIPGQSC